MLLDLAHASIRHGLQHARPLLPRVEELPDELTEIRASFVTLKRHARLRGCIGSLMAHRPLALDVATNAFYAAFRDPRFPPLREAELATLTLHLSLLTRPEPMTFSSEADLLAQLRPGEDGLILEAGDHCGTFLPAVWEELPTPELFLAHLKRKAGLPADYWSSQLRVSRYAAETVDEPGAPAA